MLARSSDERRICLSSISAASSSSTVSSSARRSCSRDESRSAAATCAQLLSRLNSCVATLVCMDESCMVRLESSCIDGSLAASTAIAISDAHTRRSCCTASWPCPRRTHSLLTPRRREFSCEATIVFSALKSIGRPCSAIENGLRSERAREKRDSSAGRALVRSSIARLRLQKPSEKLGVKPHSCGVYCSSADTTIVKATALPPCVLVLCVFVF